MRRYEIVGLFARRLDAKPGRVQTILSKLTESGAISGGGDSKRYPGDLAEPEIVSLLLAVLGERGVSTAPAVVAELAALRDHTGRRLDAALQHLLFGPPRNVAHVIVRQNPPGVSTIDDGEHVLFGAASPTTGATAARIVSGSTLAAIAAELQGLSPIQADAAAAISKIRRSY